MRERLRQVDEVLRSSPPSPRARYREWNSLLQDEGFESADDTVRVRVLAETGRALQLVILGDPGGRIDTTRFGEVWSLFERALEIASGDSGWHGKLAIEVSEQLAYFYEATRSPDIWELCVGYADRLAAAVPAGDRNRPLYLAARGILVGARALATGDDVWSDALGLLTGACLGTERGSGLQCTASSHLAHLHFARFGRTGELLDLQETLNAARRALAAEHGRPRDRARAAHAGGLAFCYLDQSIGDEEAGEAAMAMADVAESHGMPVPLLRARALRYRFRRHRHLADINRAIECYGEVLAAIGSSGPDSRAYACGLDDRANAFYDRYTLTGGRSDLDAAVSGSRSALTLLPDDSEDRTRVLKNLGLTLLFACRRGDLGAPALDEAVDVLRQSTAGRSEEPDVRVAALSGFAHSLICRAAANPTLAPTVLGAAQDALEQAADVLRNDDRMSYGHRSLRREEWSEIIADRVGVLLWRAELVGPEARQECWRQMVEAGEAAKSPLLAAELNRSNLADVTLGRLPTRLVEREHRLLDELADLDALDLSLLDTPDESELVRWRRRSELRARLEATWDQMLDGSPFAQMYVADRRHGVWTQPWFDRLAASKNVVVLSALRFTDPRQYSRPPGTRTFGLALAVARQGQLQVAMAPDDPTSAAVRSASREIAGDGGTGHARETWDRAFVALLRQLEVQVGPEDRIVISPPPLGRALPWHLLVERAGWVSGSGRPPVILTVPSLTLAGRTFDPEKRRGPLVLDYQGFPARSVDLTRARGPVRLRAADLGMSAEEFTEAGRGIRSYERVYSPPERNIVIGSPRRDLPGARREAWQVSRILRAWPLTGRRATRDRVLAALPEARVLHLAAHASFDRESPLDSLIALADGSLRMRDLTKRITDAELVVLSGCESGLGVVIGGEGVDLAHILLRAGARQVLASLWPVDDEATAELMQVFYRRWTAGDGAAAALAAAVTHVRAVPRWTHPYYWAPFVLLGYSLEEQRDRAQRD